MVERIEEVEPELQIHGLPYLEVLHHRSIQSLQAVSAEYGPARISQSILISQHKIISVKPLLNCRVIDLAESQLAS